jgi:hypothetical protein
VHLIPAAVRRTAGLFTVVATTALVFGTTVFAAPVAAHASTVSTTTATSTVASTRLAPPRRHPTLRVGSHGYAVRWVQQRLGIPRTGHFRARTARAVRHFRRMHHMTAVAVVGRATWRALLARPATMTTSTTSTPIATSLLAKKRSPAPSPSPTTSTTSPSPTPTPTATTTSPTPTPTATTTSTTPTPTATTTSPTPTPTATSPAPTAPPVVPAPSGQTTLSGLLPVSDSTFSTGPTTWSSYLGGGVSQTDAVGHDGAGALAVVSAGAWSGAMSLSFAATPGARYSASAWVVAQTAGHSVGLGLQFRDSSGAVISGASLTGQRLLDSTGTWTQTLPMVAFAPAGAVSGQLLFLDYDGGVGDAHWIDDVSVSSTTGTAAALVTPLSTSGTNVLDGLGRKVTFAGVDIDGLQYSSTANVTTSEVAAAQKWGANFVRLPLGENYLLAGDCDYDANYLSRVDGMVDAVTSRGMFVMLDLHTLAVTPCAAPKQQPMPDSGAVTFWQTLATRYQGNPLVGFDLYNEPHDVSDAVWHNGGSVTSSGITYTAVGMQKLYDTVRATGATNLVFASGTGWASQFPTTAPLTGTSNLIYAAHAYTCPNGTPQSGATCNPGPAGVYDPSGILSNFDAIGATMPVMVTEFGWPDKLDGQYNANVIAYAGSHNMVGWDVYAFDNTTTGRFDLVNDTGALYDPAPAGMAVMTGMLSD